MSSTADPLLYHQPTLYLQRSGDYQWQLPAPTRDRLWQRRERPYVSPQQPMANYRGGFPDGSRRNSMAGTQPRSSTAMGARSPTEYSFSPSSSIHMSSPRDLHDMRSVSESIVSRTDRPESLAKSLVSKGYKLLRRQNSKSDLTSLRTMDWMERSNVENMYRSKNSKHSRWQSTDSVGLKHEISKPYNFHHLTHTHAKQVQELKRASHNELVTGFFAIRASQAPQQELKGIKAESLAREEPQPEVLPQDMIGPVTPPSKSPTRSQFHRSNSSFGAVGGLKYSRSNENFSQPSPGAYKVPTSPTGPSFRVSSRQYKHDLSTSNQEQTFAEDAASMSNHALSPAAGTASLDDDSYGFSNVPHAVTTPDESALTLRSFPFGSSGTELADVPEEDEQNVKRTSSGSGIRHSRSFPSTRLLSYRCSQTLPLPAADGNRSLSLDASASSRISIPCIDQPFDEVPIRPRVSRRISVGPKGIDASWEEDIDYCYEHAAEADCDFDWEHVSSEVDKPNSTARGEHPDLNIDTTLEDLIVEYENIRFAKSESEDTQKYPSPTNTASPHLLPPLHTLMPDLVYSPANSTKSPNSSIPSALTPAQLFPSPQSISLPAKSGQNFDFSPSLLIPKDYESHMLQEEIYQDLLDAEHVPEHHYPVHDIRSDASSSRYDSPRSSGSPISKCNSQESMMYSSVLAMRRARDADSVGSLPELVHSKVSQERFNDSPSSHVTPANIAIVDPQQGIRQHRRSQSLAADIARQSMLEKAASYSSLTKKEEDAFPSAHRPSTKRRDRSHSDAAARILSVSSQPTEITLARKRSGSSGSALSGSSQRSSRASYSLFPPVPSKSIP